MSEESQLHPFVARPSAFEPVLTTSQKLTPAQKKHLDQFQDRDDLLRHLSSFHGQTFEEGTEKELPHHIDPQVAERFGIGKRHLTSSQTLRLRHLQEHIENIEERVRTAPKTRPLTPAEFRSVGIHVAPGFLEPKGVKSIENQPKGVNSMEKLK